MYSWNLLTKVSEVKTPGTHIIKQEETTLAGIDQSKIRNFCIIAHIDHGKSTLADRIIEKTGLLTDREMQNQVLDNMDLERERGITIKSQAVRIIYHAEDGEEYIFNLIDTPGHVDFNYEVSRSLAACEGAVLVVDAAQGIEAQTLANVYLALDHDLEIMPVINKIDLPSADPERVVEEIEDIIGIEAEDAPKISAKNGINIEQVLEQIVEKIPAPGGSPENPLQALIFDSVYDSYKGVIIFARIMEGTIKKGTNMLMMATGAKAEVVEVGTFGAGQFFPCDELSAGMVGYVTASLKNVKDFEQFPDIKSVYYYALRLGKIFSDYTDKDVARAKLALWYNEIEEFGYDTFTTVANSIENHYERILNYFVNRSTNAAAEAFNAKIKAFRASSRGVVDKRFFLYRLANVYA